MLGVAVALLWTLSASPAHAAISVDDLDDRTVLDVKSLYTDSAWSDALRDAWDAAGDANAKALYMLQTSSAADADAIDSIESAAEMSLGQFAPPDMFFFMATKDQATSLRDVAGVDSVEAVPAKIKIVKDLRMKPETDSDEDLIPQALVEMSPGSTNTVGQAQMMANMWQNMVRMNVMGSQCTCKAVSPDLVTVEQVKAKEMMMTFKMISEQPETMWVVPTPRNKVDPPSGDHSQDISFSRRLNNDADDITQSGTSGSTPLRAAGLDGSGEIVGIADSGLDDGSCFFNANRNLPRDREADRRQRKVIQYIAFADGVAGEQQDHGTHVAGSVAGHCTIVEGRVYDGMAPQAKIAFFDIGRPGQQFLDVPASLYSQMFPFASEAGATIHTNSWGGTFNGYTINSRDVDRYSYENPEFVILVAAGNDGANGVNSVGTPATAKNCISVGASVNSKLGSIEDIAGFSSVGPTADGRIKPDVVAPGHNVLSAASLLPCSITSQSGTSMATPVVAGTVALVRQYFREGYYPTGVKSAANKFTPSGALLKAVIVHSGRRMTGNVRGDRYPGIVQGFGRVDMDSVLPLGAPRILNKNRLWVRAAKIGGTSVAIKQGETFQMTFNVKSEGTLKATLVWMDPPSSVNARRNLVNDIDLKIEKPGGASVFPTVNGNTGVDRINNVEMIETTVSPGEYVIKVSAFAIRFGASQAYALVVTGPFDPPDEPEETPDTGGSGRPPRGASGFERVSSNTCAGNGLDPIYDVATCSLAASTLGLSDTTVQPTQTAGVPEGCYFKEGNLEDNRLWLSLNPANIGRGGNSERTPICRENVALFKKITSGTCEGAGFEPITDQTACATAATYLGLADTSATRVSESGRPEGCYYKDTLPGNALFLATSVQNIGNGAIGDRQPICQISAASGRSNGNSTGNETNDASRLPLLAPPAVVVALALIVGPLV